MTSLLPLAKLLFSDLSCSFSLAPLSIPQQRQRLASTSLGSLLPRQKNEIWRESHWAYCSGLGKSCHVRLLGCWNIAQASPVVHRLSFIGHRLGTLRLFWKSTRMHTRFVHLNKASTIFPISPTSKNLRPLFLNPWTDKLPVLPRLSHLDTPRHEPITRTPVFFNRCLCGAAC